LDDYAGHVTRFEVPELVHYLEPHFDVVEVWTEGFPFQRMVMKLYDASIRRGGSQHEFEAIRDRPAYRAYVRVMPALLSVDHLLRRLKRGTTIVVTARKPL
jgi:hypothetical protein